MRARLSMVRVWFEQYKMALLPLAVAALILWQVSDAIGVTVPLHAMAGDTWESMYADSGGNYFVAMGWWIAYQGSRALDSALGVFGYCVVSKTNGSC